MTWTNKQLISDAMERMATGDTKAIGALMHPNFVWTATGTNSWSGEYRGRDAVRKDLFAPLFANFTSTYVNRPVNIIAEGDVVVVECRAHAMTKSGKPYDQAYCYVIRMQDGMMVSLIEHRADRRRAWAACPMTDRLKIGDVARATRRSVDTLRWYEREGLLPGVSRDTGGRRVYRRAHIGWLRFLGRLKTTRMSVADMKRYAELATAGAESAPEREALLIQHRERLGMEIERLIESRKILDAKIDYYREWQRTGQRPSEIEIPLGNEHP